jgi:16S rRNA (adenine1518-N6/adenine1519-N6)-dimethyltransferase
MIKQTKELCQQYGIKPARSKGQNFLINPNVYDGIIESAGLSDADSVLEVGPGLGFLTERLSTTVKQVVAVELDDKLAKVLLFRMNEQKRKNIVIINHDVLDFPNLDFPKGFLENYHVVANLPYNITSVFLRKLLTASLPPASMTLLLQKEVAERIVAEPGKLSLLALSVQFYTRPSLEFVVGAADFWPSPKVDSAVIRLVRDNQYVDKLGDEKEIALFFRLVKFGFVAKRKMLKNNLAAGLGLKQEEIIAVLLKLNFDPKVRAQNLSIDDWLKIFGSLRQFMI